MDVLEAVMTRRMAPRVAAKRPKKEEVEELLEAAVRAPTHHLTEPWRFIVLAGDALDGLGEAMAERVREEHADDPQLEQRLELERGRPHRAPLIIVVVYVPSTNPKAIEIEDRYSVGAAVQNMLLVAHANKLGAYWRTGPAAESDGVKRHLGLNDREEIAGFIYLGYPEEQERDPTSREPAHSRTEWRGW